MVIENTSEIENLKVENKELNKELYTLTEQKARELLGGHSEGGQVMTEKQKEEYDKELKIKREQEEKETKINGVGFE